LGTHREDQTAPRKAQRLAQTGWRFAAAIAVAGYEGRALADEDDEVVVLGSTPSSGFVSKASVDDAPREITDASSLIESVPGVHVRRLGGDDGFATLSIRGSTSSEVAILFAGVPMTGAADPSLDLSTLPLWPGARIRIYRSFAPAAFGPGSLGGTLVLEPPRTTDPERTETWAAVGSFGEARLRAADVRSLGDGGARIVTALSASRADDDFTYYNPVANPPAGSCLYAPSASCNQTRQNNGHASISGLVAFALPLGSGGTLTMTTLLQGRRQELPGSIEYPTPFAALSSNRELLSLDLSELAGPGAWSVRGWARRDELELDNKPGTSPLLPTHSENAIDALGVSGGWRGSVARGFSIEARADGSSEANEPGLAIPASAETPSASRLAFGAGLDAVWSAPRTWKLGASGRIDADADHAPGLSTQGFETRPTGHLGSEVQVGPVVLTTHGGAIARPASFVELYGSPGGVIPNPNLQGESAWTVDGGGRVVLTRGPVHGQADLAVFGTWARNLILFIPSGTEGLVEAENIGRARIFGLEAGVGAWGYGFDVRAAYTGLATFNDSQTPETSGSPPLPGRPAHDLVADIGYSLGPARVRYGVDAVTGMYYDNVKGILIPARVLQSTGLRLDVPHVPGLRVALEIRNLFDVRTVTYAGFSGPSFFPIGDQYDYPLPGRSVLVTARWTFQPSTELAPREDR
jgi:hypothetical protein